MTSQHRRYFAIIGFDSGWLRTASPTSLILFLGSRFEPNQTSALQFIAFALEIFRALTKLLPP